MYKIGEVGSGVDYMYLDSCGGSWQMSKYLVNTSQGALGQTLNQLYMGKAYQVRLHPCVDSCGFQNLLKHSFGMLSRHSGSFEELKPRLGSFSEFPMLGKNEVLLFYSFFSVLSIFVLAVGVSVVGNDRCNTKQTKPFPQSNSSVYAFYNDAPPVLDYIQGYGHTTPPKLLLVSPQSKSQNRTDVDVCC